MRDGDGHGRAKYQKRRRQTVQKSTPSGNVIDPQVASDGPTRLLQSLQECRDVGLRLGLVRTREHQHTDAPYALGLLRTHHNRPRRRRAAEQRDELAPPHSITSSACASSAAGRSRPKIFAVRKLSTSVNRVGCSIGKSAGFAPLRIRSTKKAARRERSSTRAAYAIRPPASACGRYAKIVGKRWRIVVATSCWRWARNVPSEETTSPCVPSATRLDSAASKFVSSASTIWSVSPSERASALTAEAHGEPVQGLSKETNIAAFRRPGT